MHDARQRMHDLDEAEPDLVSESEFNSVYVVELVWCRLCRCPELVWCCVVVFVFRCDCCVMSCCVMICCVFELLCYCLLSCGLS